MKYSLERIWCEDNQDKNHHDVTLAFTITNQKSNSQPLHYAHPFHCTYVMYVVCFDFYCFYVLFHLHFICYSALGPQVCY